MLKKIFKVECTFVPSCTSLGYSKILSASCDGGTFIKCPFDANYGICIKIPSEDDDIKRLEQRKLFDLFNNNTVEVMLEDYISMGGVQLVSKHSSGTPACCTSAMAFGTNATGFAILCKGVGRVKLSSSDDPTRTNETNYTATYISGVNPYPAQQFSPVVSGGK